MFKTVKVGDTSLQYTIVSQTDDSSVRSNPSNVSPTIRKSKIKRKTRHRKTVILVLVTMVMGCGIVIAAVLVPILVASKLVGNLPESAKFKTFAIAASSIQGYEKYDQNGHKYVELLPIKRPPVDAVIEFQDELSLTPNVHEWVPDTSSYHKKIPTSNIQSKKSIIIDEKTSILNSSQVTIYYNKTEKARIEAERSSVWRFSSNLSSFLSENVLLTSALAVVAIFLILVALTSCRKQKLRLNKTKLQEDKTQRNQLLTAIPIEDD